VEDIVLGCGRSGWVMLCGIMGEFVLNALYANCTYMAVCSLLVPISYKLLRISLDAPIPSAVQCPPAQSPCNSVKLE
jgi:hypothetical protein